MIQYRFLTAKQPSATVGPTISSRYRLSIFNFGSGPSLFVPKICYWSVNHDVRLSSIQRASNRRGRPPVVAAGCSSMQGLQAYYCHAPVQGKKPGRFSLHLSRKHYNYYSVSYFSCQPVCWCALVKVCVMYMFARLIMNVSGCYWPLFVYEALNMHKV